jgi:hypothetical protein
MQRNATIAPAFDHRPVDRRKKKMLAAPAYERVFDFGEVVEVVQSYEKYNDCEPRAVATQQERDAEWRMRLERRRPRLQRRGFHGVKRL